MPVPICSLGIPWAHLENNSCVFSAYSGAQNGTKICKYRQPEKPKREHGKSPQTRITAMFMGFFVCPVEPDRLAEMEGLEP